MNTGCIYNIDITTNSKEKYSVSSDNFNHFYIANINDAGDEINYSAISDLNSLFANFFMIKILKDETPGMSHVINHLMSKQDIVKIGISFTNGKYQEFELPKRRIANQGMVINKYENAFFDEDNNLCILITDKNLKYKKELFE